MRRSHVETYEDASANFRWRLVASNGRIIADSAEGYTTLAALRKALRRMTALDVTNAFHAAYKSVTPNTEEQRVEP